MNIYPFHPSFPSFPSTTKLTTNLCVNTIKIYLSCPQTTAKSAHSRDSSRAVNSKPSIPIQFGLIDFVSFSVLRSIFSRDSELHGPTLCDGRCEWDLKSSMAASFRSCYTVRHALRLYSRLCRLRRTRREIERNMVKVSD